MNTEVGYPQKNQRTKYIRLCGLKKALGGTKFLDIAWKIKSQQQRLHSCKDLFFSGKTRERNKMKIIEALSI